MASQKDLDFTYSTIDRIFRLSMGETGDFSGAMYNGNFKLSLEEAQEAKHQFIVDQLRIGKHSRVLDLGCGWGPFISFATRTAGASCTGLTLSQAQARACRQKGLDVHIRDCRSVDPTDFGYFHAAVSIGAFEHFCSVEDYKKGRQNDIYKKFFESVAGVLPQGGRFFLQTMVFGKNMLPYEQFNIKANKNSDEYILALMEKQFPGSWLPYGKEMILENASPWFDVKFISSGRLDYIQTIAEWRKRLRKFHFRKYLSYAGILPQLIFNPNLMHRVEVFRRSPNKICFERELMDHYRIVLEKR